MVYTTKFWGWFIISNRQLEKVKTTRMDGKKDTQANINQKKHGVSTSKQVSDKVNLKASTFTELYFLKVKGLVQQKNITILKFVHIIA